jgi:hypothetical protein
MEQDNKELREKESDVLLSFLKRTRDGQYAKIDEFSLPYARIKERREEPYPEEHYHSIRIRAADKTKNGRR